MVQQLEDVFEYSWSCSVVKSSRQELKKRMIEKDIAWGCVTQVTVIVR